jgi:hypothetical protein
MSAAMNTIKNTKDANKETPTRFWDAGIRRNVRPSFPSSFGQRHTKDSYASWKKTDTNTNEKKDLKLDSVNEFPSLLSDTTPIIKSRVSFSGSSSLVERLKITIAQEEEEATLRRYRREAEEERRRNNAIQTAPLTSHFRNSILLKRQEKHNTDEYDYDHDPSFEHDDYYEEHHHPTPNDYDNPDDEQDDI